MKKLIPMYLLIVFVWALASTALGAQSASGGSFFYRLGRNFPSAFAWPIEVVKSPYTLVKWVTTPNREPVFEGAHASCVATRRNEEFCDCMVEVMQGEFSAREFEAIDGTLSSGRRAPPEFAAALLRTAETCN